MSERAPDINAARNANTLVAPSITTSASLRRLLPALVLLLILAGAFRLHLAWWRGHIGDLLCFQAWSVGDLKWTAEAPGPPIVIPNYPPLYLSITRLLFWLHEAVHLPGDIHIPISFSTFEYSRPILLLYKMPAILADLAAGVIVFVWAASTGRRWSAIAMAAFYLFSPAILYDGAYWGQTDTILCAFLIAAAFAYATRRPAMLASSVVLAASLKAQTVCVLPVLMAAVALEWRRIWAHHAQRLLVAAILTMAGVVALAALTGNLAQFYRGYFTVIGGDYSRTSVDAMNLWWLLTRPWCKAPVLRDFPSDTNRLLGLLSYRTIGLLAFALAVVLIIRRWHVARYRPDSILLACAAAAWAFFNLCTEMHERYSVVAAGLTCAAVIFDRRWYAYGTLASLAALLNMVYVSPLLYPPWGWLQIKVNWFIWPVASAAHTTIAVIQTLMLLLLLESLWKAGRRGAPTT